MYSSSLWLGGFRTRLASMRIWVRSLASLSGLRILQCCKLWCSSQMWLRPGVAVAVVWDGSYGSNLTPSLGTSLCCRCSPKMKNNKYTCMFMWSIWYEVRIWTLSPYSGPLSPNIIYHLLSSVFFFFFFFFFVFCFSMAASVALRFFVFLPFLGPLPWHMVVPRPGVKSEL